MRTFVVFVTSGNVCRRSVVESDTLQRAVTQVIGEHAFTELDSLMVVEVVNKNETSDR